MSMKLFDHEHLLPLELAASTMQHNYQQQHNEHYQHLSHHVNPSGGIMSSGSISSGGGDEQHHSVVAAAAAAVSSAVTSTSTSSSNAMTAFELRIAIIVGITFSITLIVGIIGNSLVLVTIFFQKQMRSTTNILILNLAIAELVFIIICVPSTGLNYVLSKWYFGDLGCRIVQYTSNVTAYVIILLLVFMSLDRYLAIRLVGGTSIRNQRNATWAVTVLWLLVLVLNVPHLFLWEEYRYVAEHLHENRTVCILKYNIIVAQKAELEDDPKALVEVNNAETKIQAYYGVFVFAAYLVPLLSIVVIYGLIMIRLRAARGQQVSKSKRRVTFMVILVVASFVLCWGPLQIMLFLQHVLKREIQTNELGITILVITNCIAYLNTCINPIIYGFANQDFRAAYAAVLKCEFNRRTYTAVATQINPRELASRTMATTAPEQSCITMTTSSNGSNKPPTRVTLIVREPTI